MLKKYFVNILLSLDQLGNVLMGGSPDETVSSRLGKLKRRHGGRIPFRKRPVASSLDKFLEWLDPGHSIDAIEEDEGDRDVF